MSRRDDYLRCRDIGHAWDEVWDWKTKAPWGTRRVLRCDSCQTERVEIVNIAGTVDARHYDYQDAYKTVTGLSKVEARAERRRRAGMRRRSA